MSSGQPTLSAFAGVDIPNYDVITNCMHCALCLPTCPTYVLTGLEKSSPRGRIRLIKAVADGDLPITDGFIREMNFCLDCQACETACPAGVKYGSLVEAARAQIYQGRRERWLSSTIKRTALNWAFRNQERLKSIARFLRFYERSGLKGFLLRTGLLKFVSRRLHDIQPLTPAISKRFSSDSLAEVIHPVGDVHYRVGFLTGCIMDVAFSEVNLDTVRLLLHHGCEVVIPRDQACCGSLQAHNGDMIAARQMARHNIQLFDRGDFDYIVMNSAGCGAFMKEYGHQFADDPELRPRAERISEKVRDITEFLMETGFRPRRTASEKSVAPSGRSFDGKRVTYHDACHLVHTQKISQQPRQLLKMIPGIDLVELPESTWCCGSAGIYNIVHFADAMKLLDRKIENIKKIQPDIIVTGNPGCLVQIQHGLQKEGLAIDLQHTATFLWRACEDPQAA
ncbi:MAG: (Fe-S)-binding protein [Ignavibacteria bacterium]|nr:(Fe-S)-binding protein [Ignavibacteria bacterium]